MRRVPRRSYPRSSIAWLTGYDGLAVVVSRRQHWGIYGQFDQPSIDPFTGKMAPATEEEREEQSYWDRLYPRERVFRYMGLGLLNLVGEVRDALDRYIEELDASAPLRANFERRWEELDREEFA